MDAKDNNHTAGSEIQPHRDPNRGHLEPGSDGPASKDGPAVRSTEEGKGGQTSERKRIANRENAQMSTGPRTAIGKAYSRQNALKHGLFARHKEDFVALGEAPRKYAKLLEHLCGYYQPVGRAEELEVERIAVCWWRLRRAWRYENSANHTSNDGTPTRSPQVEAICKRVTKEAVDTVLRLRALIDQVNRYGVFPDLQEKFAACGLYEGYWGLFQSYAEELLRIVEFPRYAEGQWATQDVTEWPTPIPFSQEYEKVRAIMTLTQATIHFECVRWYTKIILSGVTTDEELIPNGDALDRLLRYETNFERSLGRAMDRLERLQRRRKGEPVMPPVNVRLTQ